MKNQLNNTCLPTNNYQLQAKTSSKTTIRAPGKTAQFLS